MLAVLQTHASVALHTMIKVDTQTFTSAAHVAKRTVVNRLTRVIEKVAHVTVILCHGHLALLAFLRHRLSRAALHAHHFFHRVAIDGVIAHVVVTKSA